MPIIDKSSHIILEEKLNLDPCRDAVLPILWASPGSGKTYFLRQIQCLCEPNHRWLERHKKLSLESMNKSERFFYDFSTKVCNSMRDQAIFKFLQNRHPIFISFGDGTDYDDYVEKKGTKIFRSADWSLSVRILWE